MAAMNRWTAIPERRLSGDADNDVFPCKRAVAEDTIEEFAAGNGRSDTKELPNWAVGFGDAWAPGEAAALQKLQRFLDASLEGYGAGRDVPALQATSLLSP